MPFSCREVRSALKALKNSKAAGIDLIKNEFLKYGADVMLLPLVKLFNKILQVQKFPTVWNISFISVIHKSGSTYDCENYRGISVCSCLGKLFTKLIQIRISNFLSDNDILEDNQAGFRANYRTTDQIFIVKTLLNKYLHKLKKPIYACFVDFSKAFDSVWRQGLFHKLHNLGIKGNILETIKHMYSTTQFCIKKDNFISNPIPNNKGVKQGDSLSPTLFNIYINDLGSCLNGCDPVLLGDTPLNHLLFADDLLLMSESSSGLQECLGKLEQFCHKWKLEVNLNKTKIMIFSKGRRKYENYYFSYRDAHLEIVDQYKYLGVSFFYNGNLKHAADDLYNKGLKAMFSLRKKVSNFSQFPLELSSKLFDSLLRPIITYGSEVWIADYSINLKNIDLLPPEKLHHKFCKAVLGINRYSSNLASRCEMGRIPVIFFILKIMFKFYERLKLLPSNRLLSKAFQLDQELHLSGDKSWYSSLVKTLRTAGIKENDLSTFDVETLDKKLLEFYMQQTTNSLNTINVNEDSKLKLYSSIVNFNGKAPTYLKLNLKQSNNSIITKFRISAHKLSIERGRYARPKIPRNKRVCKFCNEIENEMHFILFCKQYSGLRDVLFKEFCIEKSQLSYNKEAVIQIILNPENRAQSIQLCKYLHRALQLRDQ